MDLGLDGKVAAVTGGTRGIGLATAEALAREGARVAVCARGLEGLRMVEERIRGAGGECLTVQADLGADREAADRFIGKTVETYGGLDVLVAAQGVHKIKEFADLTDDEWQEAFDHNFFGTVRACRAAIPHMQQQRWGRVVIVSAGSIHKQSIGPDVHPHYTAAKAAVANLAKFLSKQYALDNILVNSILPGDSIVPEGHARYRRLAEEQGVSFEEAFVREATGIGYVPAVGRPGTPEEFASVIVFLCSERASYLTGVQIPIDGGGMDWG
ncbi:MAG: SDR family NAD(P)-dependent oxidoreductase [Dehalococcoidia bacterium]